METGQVRKQVQQALAKIKERAQQRRARSAAAEEAYGVFLEHIATPIAKQVASALKVEGYTFTVFTPSRGLRLALDKGRDDFIELALDADSDRPQVIARVSYTRGSRTIDSERPVKQGVPPDALVEEDVLEFFLQALEPFLER
jgi:hypothetical protein